MTDGLLRTLSLAVIVGGALVGGPQDASAGPTCASFTQCVPFQCTDAFDYCAQARNYQCIPVSTAIYCNPNSCGAEFGMTWTQVYCQYWQD